MPPRRGQPFWTGTRRLDLLPCAVAAGIETPAPLARSEQGSFRLGSLFYRRKIRARPPYARDAPRLRGGRQGRGSIRSIDLFLSVLDAGAAQIRGELPVGERAGLALGWPPLRRSRRRRRDRSQASPEAAEVGSHLLCVCSQSWPILSLGLLFFIDESLP